MSATSFALATRPTRWLAGAILGVAVGLMAGMLLTRWLGPAPAPDEGDMDVTFARDMGAHHAQAVEMALIIRERSADEALRLFALDMLLTQQAQIGQMQGWLAAWQRPLSGPDAPMAGMGEMMGMATHAELKSLQTLTVPEAEIKFLQLMIRHHEGGVLMAREVLTGAHRPEVQRLASAIEVGQQSEIDYMRGLLAERGAAPLPSLELAPLPHEGH